MRTTRRIAGAGEGMFRHTSLALVALGLIAHGCDERTPSSPRPEPAAEKERGGEPPLDDESLDGGPSS